MPTKSAHVQEPELLHDMIIECSNMIAPWARDCIMLLGLFFVTDGVVSNRMEKKQHLTVKVLPILTQIENRPIDLQFLRLFCHCTPHQLLVWYLI